MTIFSVNPAGDERLAPYRAVSDPDLARRLGLFIAEGRFVVERLLKLGTYRIESLLMTQAALSALGEAMAGLDPAVPVFVAEQHHFTGITGFNLHRGCLALACRPAALDLLALTKPAKTVLVLDAVTDPDNVGGVFRNAAAFGVDAVILSPTTCDPLYRKAIRTSMAATLSVPFARSARWPGDVSRLRDAGFTVVAFSPRGAISLEEFVGVRPSSQPLALVFGTEGAGISPEVELEADISVRIPVAAAVDSLNVAVASGIALSRLCRM